MDNIGVDDEYSTVFPVEEEWHHKILAPLGFVPDKSSVVGLMRSYTYTHPELPTVAFKCHSAGAYDNWHQKGTVHCGYPAELEEHVKGLLTY